MSEKQNKESKYSPEHFAKLREGVEVWNSWYEEQKNIDSNFIANLEGIYFEGIDLQGINLQGVNLQNAKLLKANLKNANLNYANLKGAELYNSNFKKAQLRQVNLQDANLDYANLEGAELRGAWFQGTRLEEVKFNHADLSHAQHLHFSDCKITGATITSTTKAPWLTLKKSYTNTMMLFTLVAVFTFFLPYIVNIAIWRSINLTQQLHSELEASLAIVATELESEGSRHALLVRKLSNRAEVVTPCFAEACKPWRIWQLLLGVRKSWFFAILSIPIILYNFARVYLTREVNILKDSEQTTGITPSWQTSWSIFLNLIPYPSGGYQYLFYIHQIVEKLLWIAVASFLFHSIFWLGDIILLPIKP